MIHLDTQISVWLYQRKRNRLSSEAANLIKRGRGLVISPFVMIELEILHEADRIDIPSVEALMSSLQETFSIEVSLASLRDIADKARTFAWTRDPFDRLIVANAMADGATLVTADVHIVANFTDAVW